MRISAAMFLVGFSTFSLIYCIQPVLPQISHDFNVTAAQSSLALSLTTGCLALATLASALAGELLGRRALMFVSLCCASVLDIADAFVPGWKDLLSARALEGVMLGGVPAVAIAYLAEEIAPPGLGLSVGLYIGGTALGGMMGRVGMGFLTRLSGWRAAAATIGVVDLVAAVLFVTLLPASRHFQPAARSLAKYHLRAWLSHLRNPGLLPLYAIGFLLLGAFVAVYNYSTFRLMAPPYSLSVMQISLIFGVYILGMLSSVIAGFTGDHIGRPPVLIMGICVEIGGILLTLFHPLAMVIVGIAVLTIGFLGAHSIASTLVGQRAAESKGHAASLYLLFFYMGSSVIGWSGGWFWGTGGWHAVVGFTVGLLLLALCSAVVSLCLMARPGAPMQQASYPERSPT